MPLLNIEILAHREILVTESEKFWQQEIRKWSSNSDNQQNCKRNFEKLPVGMT